MLFKDRTSFMKAKDELLKAGSLFEDFDFPPEESDDLTWPRASELSKSPKMIEYPLLMDVRTGKKENNVFVGALATISHRKDLLIKIFPDDQNFTKTYCGIFYFQFWNFGDWQIVAIDDRLPFVKSKNELRDVRSLREDMFFVSLAEKAYAKFKGGYDALRSTKPGDCLVDLTGGVSQLWTLSTSNRDAWFPMMKKLVDGQLPATASIVKAGETETGLDSLTTYTLKDVQEIELEDHKIIRLVKLADPWGTARQYSGAWNNEAPDWMKVPQYLRDKLVPKPSAGSLLSEFWMPYEDFQDIFSFIQFCVLSPEEMGPVGPGVKWNLTTIKGQFPRYIPNVSNIKSHGSTIYEIYPQYEVEMTDLDDFVPDGKCELVVSLLQREMKETELMTMGFSLFLKRNAKNALPLKQTFFNEQGPSGTSKMLSVRENTCRLRLTPGMYVLVVLTTPKFKLREFLLRMYKHQRFNVFGHVLHYLNESSSSRRNMIPPSSRRSPVGPFDGPTPKETDSAPRASVQQRKNLMTDPGAAN